MSIALNQQLRLSQQLVMTPQLQQAIKMLQLNRLELADAIQQEIEENVTLDDTVDDFDKDGVTSETEEINTVETEAISEVKINEDIPSDVDWSNYIDDFGSAGKANFETEARDATNFEAFTAKKTSLEDHLLWQFLMLQPEEKEKEIASQIIGNIDKDGYFISSIEAVAETCNASFEEVEDSFLIIQDFDPIGVCARNLSECLLIQLHHLGIKDFIVEQIVTKHIKNLENKNYKAIARDLEINIKTVLKSVNIIKELEPKPGREFASEEPVYITPDVYVYKTEDDFVIVVNDDGLPKLRINPYYKRAVTRGEQISSDTKDYLKDKMRSASWLIKSIHQRQKTIFNVMTSILKFQRNFFEKGITHLKPMILRDVAEDIEMHESTISRVTTNKYAYTPQGIFELKFFFSSSISRIHGEATASVSVQEKIKQIIEKENKKKPYSDNKISQILKDSNVDIARRTVAKYREILKILPSSKRKTF